MFDRSLGQCALPQRAPCRSTTGPSAPDCSCPGPNFPQGDCLRIVNLPFSNNCYRYAICYGGGMIGERECTDGLQFNPTLGQCDRAENIVPP